MPALLRELCRNYSLCRKFHEVALPCTPEESSELEVRQETAAGLQPRRWRDQRSAVLTSKQATGRTLEVTTQ